MASIHLLLLRLNWIRIGLVWQECPSVYRMGNGALIGCVERMVPPTGRISIGMSRSRHCVTGRYAAVSGVFSLALAIEKQPRQAWPERTAQEHPPALLFL